MSRLLDYDPLTGIRTTFDYDHASDTAIIGYDDPFGMTDKVLDWNKQRKANAAKTAKQAKRDMVHYARIPPMAQLDMMQRHGVKCWEREHQQKVMDLLATNEYEDCRVTHLKHG